MKITEISPVLYRLNHFHYAVNEHKYVRLHSNKSHYVYRFLCFTKGKLDVYIGDRREICRAGDTLYLIPGEKYRLAPCDGDFSLYNIFFDVVPYERQNQIRKTGSCVFLSDYDPSLCSPVCFFEDAPEFNQSRVFKNVDCTSRFDSLFSAERADTLYHFYAKSALISAISQILQNEHQHSAKGAGVRQILAYIHHNPDKELSAAALSKLFSYHKNYINALIKSSTGMTLNEYTRHIKIEYAKTLLSEGELSPTEVSLKLGYYDYSHFYKSFLSETGITPTAYVKKH